MRMNNIVDCVQVLYSSIGFIWFSFRCLNLSLSRSIWKWKILIIFTWFVWNWCDYHVNHLHSQTFRWEKTVCTPIEKWKIREFLDAERTLHYKYKFSWFSIKIIYFPWRHAPNQCTHWNFRFFFSPVWEEVRARRLILMDLFSLANRNVHMVWDRKRIWKIKLNNEIETKEQHVCGTENMVLSKNVIATKKHEQRDWWKEMGR